MNLIPFIPHVDLPIAVFKYAKVYLNLTSFGNAKLLFYSCIRSDRRNNETIISTGSKLFNIVLKCTV